MSESPVLTFDVLKNAVGGTAAAFRRVTEFQPAGGPGDKVFPPTYLGGEYAVEKRRIDGQDVDCILLDSVQSQANRMELALLDSWRAQQITLPVIEVDFASKGLPDVGRITSLEAPHRVADAILRDSYIGKKRFRESIEGKPILEASPGNASGLFGLCPTALLFGLWDSTGPKGGAGAKFQRAIVSEIVGVDTVVGKKTSSRIDPLQILKDAGPLYENKEGGWTLDEAKAKKTGNKPTPFKDGNPSSAVHGNIPPTISDGGVTMNKALQTTVISLPALRRLHFPISGKAEGDVDLAARMVLAAMGLCAATIAAEQGFDLRSRCLLVPNSPFIWELIDRPDARPQGYSLKSKEAVALFGKAVESAKKLGLPWSEESLVLTPSDELVALVKKSHDLAAKKGTEAE